MLAARIASLPSWVLEKEPGSSRGAASTLNAEPSLQAPDIFLNIYYCENFKVLQLINAEYAT